MIKQKQVVDTFLDLVEIDSPSGQEEKVSKYIVRYAKKRKWKTSRDKYGNLFVKVPGEGEPFLLSAHMDVVQPCLNVKPRVRKGVISSSGNTVLGADDKAGICAILEASDYLRKNSIKHRPLELVFTKEEESGLLGASNLNYKKIQAREGIVVDSGAPLGQITVAAPYIYTLEIKVIGKEAHGGAHPEKGINALVIAAKAISEIKLGRINQSTTANIGVIRGGQVFNTVPGEILLKGDVRSHRLETAQKHLDLTTKVFKKYVRANKARINIKAKLACPGFSYSRQDPLVMRIAAYNKEMKFKTVYKKSTGASDANIFAGQGIKAIDISYGSQNLHTARESIKISELVNITEFLARFIKD